MRRACVGLLLSGLLALPALPARTADAPIRCPESLSGTWYVFLQVRDAKSPHAERAHWSDRVWTLQVTPKHVVWTDYPYVVFDHSEGRFAGGPAMGRRLPDWKPDAAQLSEIQRGLSVNARPAVTKSLLPEAGGTWSSPKPQAAAPGFVTYDQHWTIAQKGDACVLAQTDLFGAGGGGDTGRTEYRISAREADGSLHGGYERDGHLEGTVRLLPSGPVRPRKSVGPRGIKHGRSLWPPDR